MSSSADCQGSYLVYLMISCHTSHATRLTLVHLTSASSGHATQPLTQEPDRFRMAFMAVTTTTRFVSFAVLTIAAIFIVSQLQLRLRTAEQVDVVMVNVSMVVD